MSFWLGIGHSRKCHFCPEIQKMLFWMISGKCHFVPELGDSQKMPPCPRMSMPPCSRTRKCHFIPKLVITISKMSCLLSLHFPEFEIVQNDILGQTVIFPKMVFCLRMSFCTRTCSIISLKQAMCSMVEIFFNSKPHDLHCVWTDLVGQCKKNVCQMFADSIS